MIVTHADYLIMNLYNYLVIGNMDDLIFYAFVG